jgi:hypothetical protein
LDGFADDNTTGTLFEFESLEFLKKCLDDFGKFSGLKCNAEKSSIMQVGRRDRITPEIASLGFRFEESIHILGMDINYDLSNLDSNFIRVNDNLKKGVEHWSRFNLSLQAPGQDKCNQKLTLLPNLIPRILPNAFPAKHYKITKYAG